MPNEHGAQRSVEFRDLKGWYYADLAEAWAAFHSGAVAATAGLAPLRPATVPDAALLTVLGRAAELPVSIDPGTARQFFEAYFHPLRIEPAGAARGFLTGYYEPVVDGSLVPTPSFEVPILPRPADLVTVPQAGSSSGLPAGFSAGRRAPDGTLAVYPDRAALEAWALTADAKPLVWLRDWAEVFLIHVQGSARVRLPDGSQMRLVYAGRNGHPYTSIGRMLIEAGAIAEDAMSLDALKRWIRRHGQAVGEEGRRLMQGNRSYIFFRAEPVEATARGPIGGAGLPLTPLRSIAVDRSVWSYGLPFWIETDEPVPGFGPQPLHRLFVAQDTGSAILGPARADLFLGTGEEAGRYAGLVRHAAAFTVLVPRLS